MSNLKEKIKAAQIDLIKELGIDKLDQEQKEKTVTDIGEIIQQRVVMRVVEELPEDKQDEFQGFLDKAQDNPAALDEFLKENIPGLEDMILEEIGEYKQGALEMLGKSDAGQPAEENQEETPAESVKPKEQQATDQREETKQNEANSASEKIPQKNIEEDLASGADKTNSQTESVERETGSSEKSVDAEPSDDPSSEEKDERPSESVQGAELEDDLKGVEKEQAQQEAQILEENKVDKEKVQEEELDLTEEIEKMSSGEEDNKEK